MNNKDIVHSFGSGQSNEPNETEMFFISTFATAGEMYGLLAQTPEGKPAFTSYMNEFLAKVASELDTPFLQEVPVHFIAWHYMQKYDGDMPGIDGFVKLVKEYLGSDFKPWGVVRPNSRGVLGFAYSKKAGDKYAEMEIELEKIYSASYFLDACLYAKGSQEDSRRYADIFAAGEMLSAGRNRAFIGLLKISLDSKENAEHLRDGQRGMIVSICETVLENYEVPEEAVPDLFHIATTISYLWAKGEPTSLESVLGHMETNADDLVVGFLQSVSNSKRTPKAQKMTDDVLKNAIKNRDAMLCMARDAVVIITGKKCPHASSEIAKTAGNAGQQGQQIKLK
ncbi:MAG: hypothetical protein WC506_04730 [Candidatus Micrarchaeia archaeon]